MQPGLPSCAESFQTKLSSRILRTDLSSPPPSSKGASLVAQLVKNPPTMQETQFRSLGWEDSPGEGNGNPLQYCCLENLMDCSLPGSSVRGIARAGHALAAKPPPPSSEVLSFRSVIPPDSTRVCFCGFRVRLRGGGQ